MGSLRLIIFLRRNGVGGREVITIKSNGVAKLLELLENVVRSGRGPTGEEINNVLSTESMSFMIRAYSQTPEFSREGYEAILSNLTKPNPTSKGLILSKLEEGLRSCLNYEKIVFLRQRLDKIVKLDFAKAEQTALKYLRPKTPIKTTIYLTIDGFNTGMMFEGNASLSILMFDPDKFDVAGFSHELHHTGFEYWIKRNPKLQALLKDKLYEGIIAKLIVNLLSEGLANYFCSPMMLHPPENAPEKLKEKIIKYEQNLNQMIQDIWSLLSDCLSKIVPVESCKDRLMKILLDPEGMLPPIHFVGGRIIETFDKDPKINRSEIINLCKQPAHFFALYSQVAKKHGMPAFPENLVEKISTLLKA